MNLIIHLFEIFSRSPLPLGPNCVIGHPWPYPPDLILFLTHLSSPLSSSHMTTPECPNTAGCLLHPFSHLGPSAQKLLSPATLPNECLTVISRQKPPISPLGSLHEFLQTSLFCVPIAPQTNFQHHT